MKGYSGEPRFYHGDELSKHLRELLEDATEVSIATAWMTDSELLKRLKSQAQRNVAIRIVVGVAGYFTDPVVLKQLGVTSGVALKVHGGIEPPLFHPKLYIFQRQHWRRVLVGSMNFTGSGTTRNIESMFSFEDKLRTAEQEFERFWHSDRAVSFGGFDIMSYEAKRHSALADVKRIGATDVLDEDVLATADHRVQIDPVHEGWTEYVAELKRAPEHLLWDCRRVLSDCHQLVERDWSQDLNETELDLMFGSNPYQAFGRLGQLKMSQGRFQGTENRTRRLEIGEILNDARKLKHLNRVQVQTIVERLLDIHGFGAPLATRLLVFARPDVFVVVSKKSSAGLRKRFGVSVYEDDLKPSAYLDLLEKVWKEKWFQSPQPDNLFEQELWMERAALLDLLVHEETGNVSQS